MAREDAAGERGSIKISGLFLSITKNDLDNDAAVKESKPEEEVEALLAEKVYGDGGIDSFQFTTVLPLDEFVKPGVNALEIEQLQSFPLLLPPPHFEASLFFRSWNGSLLLIKTGREINRYCLPQHHSWIVESNLYSLKTRNGTHPFPEEKTTTPTLFRPLEEDLDQEKNKMQQDNAWRRELRAYDRNPIWNLYFNVRPHLAEALHFKFARVASAAGAFLGPPSAARDPFDDLVPVLYVLFVDRGKKGRLSGKRIIPGEKLGGQNVSNIRQRFRQYNGVGSAHDLDSTMVRALEREHSIWNPAFEKMHCEIPARQAHSMILESGSGDGAEEKVTFRSQGDKADRPLDGQQIGSVLAKTDKAPKSRLGKDGGGGGGHGKDKVPSGKSLGNFISTHPLQMLVFTMFHPYIK
ncbi:hypothetical protein ACLOJK_040253 [Asimina triloba]